MDLKIVSMEELTTPHIWAKHPKHKDVSQMVTNFWNSGVQVARVDYLPYEYVDEHAARASFYQAVKRLGYDITVTMKGLRLYLVRGSNMK